MEVQIFLPGLTRAEMSCEVQARSRVNSGPVMQYESNRISQAGVIRGHSKTSGPRAGGGLSAQPTGTSDAWLLPLMKATAATVAISATNAAPKNAARYPSIRSTDA